MWKYSKIERYKMKLDIQYDSIISIVINLFKKQQKLKVYRKNKQCARPIYKKC